MIAWVIGTIIYAAACCGGVVWLARRVPPAAGVVHPPSAADLAGEIAELRSAVRSLIDGPVPPAEDERVPSIRDVAHDLDELRSTFLETMAETAESQTRTNRIATETRAELSTVTHKLTPLATDVDYLRRRAEREEFDKWLGNGDLSDVIPAVDEPT